MKKQLLKKLSLVAIGILGGASAVNAQGHWLATISGPMAIMSGTGQEPTNSKLYNGNHLAIDGSGNSYTASSYGGVGTVASRWAGAFSSGNSSGADGTEAFRITTKANNTNHYNCLVAKTDANGKFKWMIGFGNDIVSGVADDASSFCAIAVSDVGDSAVYAGGFYRNHINDFSGKSADGTAFKISDIPADNKITKSGVIGFVEQDGLVMKLSKDGVYQWHKSFGGTGIQDISGVATDSQGNLVVVGTYANTLTINGVNVPNMPIAKGVDAFVAKFDADGALLFVRSIGGTTGTGVETIFGVATDIDNAVYVAGTGDFGTVAIPITVSVDGHALPAGTGTNSYLAKFNDVGTYQWAQAITSDVTVNAQGITVDKKSSGRGVYVTGTVNGSSTAINFAGLNLLVSPTATSPYIAKFSASTGSGVGNWAKVFNTGSSSFAYSVAVNGNNEVFAGGYFITSIKVEDETTTTSGAQSGFIIKLNTEDGAVLGKKYISPGSNTRLMGLAVTNTAVYANGWSAGKSGAVAGTVTDNFAGTGGSLLFRGGSWDAYIFKWNSTTLPVSLTDFKGSKTTSGNQLSWNTVSESNNKHFEIERSADAVNFSAIQAVNTKAVSGNSTAKLSYSYLDANPLAGVNYYRLKQVDNDGKFAYSENVVALNNPLSENNEVKIYPNPGSGNIIIQFSSEFAGREVNVYNQAGQLVKSYADVSGSNHAIDITAQPSGVYFIQVLENGKSNLIKYIKQ